MVLHVAELCGRIYHNYGDFHPSLPVCSFVSWRQVGLKDGKSTGDIDKGTRKGTILGHPHGKIKPFLRVDTFRASGSRLKQTPLQKLGYPARKLSLDKPYFNGKPHPANALRRNLIGRLRQRSCTILKASLNNDGEPGPNLGVDMRTSRADGNYEVDSEAEILADFLSPSAKFSQWAATTLRFADFSTGPFLLLQLPQIILNTQNLLAENYTALSAVPWMGQLTSLLGNLSLLSYFASKRERGASLVQTVGVVSTFVVLCQLAIAGAMPSTAFVSTASTVVIGLILNFLNYRKKLSNRIWRLWGEAISIGGVTILPQVMWATFEPYLPHSILPGSLFGGLALTMIVLARLKKLTPKMTQTVSRASAWTATLLFMWGSVAQWIYLHPDNVQGLSVFTVLLGLVGNSLLLPRALFTRDIMWFTGSSWGALMQGWGVLLSMHLAQAITGFVFWGVSALLLLWLGTVLRKDSEAYSLESLLQPLVELASGTRS